MCSVWTLHHQMRSFSTLVSLISSNVHNLHLTLSNQVLLNSNDLNTLKCALLELNTFNCGPLELKWRSYSQMCTNYIQHFHIMSPWTQMTLILSNVYNLQSTSSNQTFFNSNNNLQYTQRCANALNQLKPPLKCIKYGFKGYKYSNQHLQSPILHLQCSNLQNSEPPSINRWPNVLQCTSNVKHLKSSSKHWSPLISTP